MRYKNKLRNIKILNRFTVFTRNAYALPNLDLSLDFSGFVIF